MKKETKRKLLISCISLMIIFFVCIMMFPLNKDAIKEHEKSTMEENFQDSEQKEILEDPVITDTEIQNTIVGHVHDYETEWKISADSHWNECVCGEKSAVSTHSYGEWVIIKKETEEETGIKKRVCSICKYEEIESIPLLEHTHQFSKEWKIDDGSHWKECACGEKNDVTAHLYGDWVVTKNSTETTTGSKYHVCNKCDYKETVSIPNLNHIHNFSDTWKYNSGTHWNECACGEKNNIMVHTYSNWVTIAAATCTKTGLKEHSCTVCGYKETAVISKVPHNEVVDVAISATCIQEGKTEGKHCSECGIVLIAQHIIPSKGHGTIKYTYLEPTCTEDGETTGAYCIDCGMRTIVPEKIPALGHLEKTLSPVQATCTVDGKTEGKYCKRCNKVLIAQQVVKAKGHTIVIDAKVEATCTTEGKTEGSHCSTCNSILVKQHVIPSIGHSYVISLCSPTCTEDGYRKESCSTCNMVFSDEIKPATGHTLVDYMGLEATCVKEGKTTGKRCSTCKKVIVESQSYLKEHDYVNGVCTMCHEKKGEIPNFKGKDYSYKAMAHFVADAIIEEDMSEFEKAITIHDWLTSNVDYGNYRDETGESGIFKTHKAKCSGYAYAFLILAERAGLEATYVSGSADNGSGYGAHAWNQVKVDGIWYYVDVTWDDPVWGNKDANDHSHNRYDYFLISQEDIEKDHRFCADDTSVGRCKTTYDRKIIYRYGVNNRPNECFAENANEIVDAAQKYANEGVHEFILWYADSSMSQHEQVRYVEEVLSQNDFSVYHKMVIYYSQNSIKMIIKIF